MSLTLPLFLAMVLGHVAGAGGALWVGRGAGARGLATAAAIVGGGAGLALGLDALIRGAAVPAGDPGAARDGGGRQPAPRPPGRLLPRGRRGRGHPSALFGGAYSRVYEGTRSLRLLGAMLNLFLLAVSLVPFADNVITFLLLWEADVGRVLLPGADRVRAAGDPPGRSLVSGHGARGTGAVDGGLPARGGERANHRFAELRAAAAALPSPARNAVFVLALLGFGSKAGLVPLHVWLPLAHPAAPAACRRSCRAPSSRWASTGCCESRWTSSAGDRPGGAATS